MKKAIIHISDLHITEHKDDDGRIINSSWFTTHDVAFRESIFALIKEKKANLNIDEFYLVISGDLSNTSTQFEYETTKIFLEKFLESININKSNVLIVPGNHDINWFENKRAFIDYTKSKSNKIKNTWEFNEEKFIFFESFYNNFFNDPQTKFDCNKIVMKIIPINNTKVLLIGINSILLSSYNAVEYGDFDVDKLDRELEASLNEYNDYERIAIFHHNPDINSNSEIVFLKDWNNKKIVFQKFNIKTFLFGHEHTYGASRDDSFFNYIATGSLGINSIKVNNYINIIEIIDNINNLKLKNNFSKLEKDGKKGNPDFGFWNDINDPECIKEFTILEKPNLSNNIVTSPLFPSNIKIDSKEFTNLSNSFLESSVDVDYSDLLLKLVKEKKAFKSGHFHWSENSKSHNWIDIPNLLNSRHVVTTCQKAFYDIIIKNSIHSDLIIGIGMEGSFLGAPVSLQLNCSYTFLPYEYRYNDHDDYEKKLNIFL